MADKRERTEGQELILDVLKSVAPDSSDIRFEQKDVVFTDGQREKEVGDIEWAIWGSDNDRPAAMARLAAHNHIKPKLTRIEEEYILGSGLQVYEKRIENGQRIIEPVENPQIEDWLEEAEAYEYIAHACNNLVMSGNVFTQYIRSLSGDVVELLCSDSTDVRVSIERDRRGKAKQFGILPDWTMDDDDDKNKLFVIPAYDKAKIQNLFMTQGRHRQMGQPFYSFPVWWSSEEWTIVSNLIPKYHSAGLRNGYNVKYHVKIPASYFDGCKDEAAKKKKKEELRNDLDRFFSGVDKSQKSILTVYDVDMDGKPLPGLMIELVGQGKADESYIKLNEAANLNQAAAHGVSPSLAGIDTGGRLGGSGSEARIHSQLHTALRTPIVRNILTKPFRLVGKINGWPRNQFVYFADTEITTMDENSGKPKTVTAQ